MKRVATFFLIVIISNGVAMPPLRADQAAATIYVGSLGDESLIDLPGESPELVEAVRSALRRDPDFQEAAGAGQLRKAFLSTLRDRLILGFKDDGYPNPQISTEIKAGRVNVTADLGKQCTKTTVECEGGGALPVKDLTSRMTQMVPDDRFPVSLDRYSVSVASVPEAAGSLRGLNADISLGFDPISVETDRGFVSAELARFGYYRTRFDISVTPRDQTSVLTVAVTDPGPRTTFDHLEVTGNTRNDTASIVKFLGLKQGDVLDLPTLERLQQRLYDSGRFMVHKLEFMPSFDGPVTLVLEVSESNVAPLSQPLPESDQAILRVLQWLQTSLEHGDGISVTGFVKDGLLLKPLTAVISPKDGLFAEEGPFTVMATREHIGVIYSPYHLNGTIPLKAKSVTLKCTLLPSDPPDPVHPTSVSLGCELNDLGGTTTDANPPAAKVDLRISPAAALEFFHKHGNSAHIDGNVGVFDMGFASLSFVAATGQPLTLVTDPAGVLFFGSAASSVPALAAKTLATFEDRDRPGASTPFASMVCTSIASTLQIQASGPGGDPAKAARATAAVRKILQPDVFAGLDAGLLDDFATTQHFVIPISPDQLKSASPYYALSRMALPPIEKQFPAGTWMRSVCRIEFLLFAGRPSAASTELQSFVDARSTGPIAELVLATLFDKTNPDVAKLIAAHGLQRVNREAFVSDCQAVLVEGGGIRKVADRIAAHIRELTPAELDDLTGLMQPEFRDSFRFVADALRENPNRAVDDVLVEFAGTLWDAGLSGTVADALRNIRDRPAR